MYLTWLHIALKTCQWSGYTVILPILSSLCRREVVEGCIERLCKLCWAEAIEERIHRIGWRGWAAVRELFFSAIYPTINSSTPANGQWAKSVTATCETPTSLNGFNPPSRPWKAVDCHTLLIAARAEVDHLKRRLSQVNLMCLGWFADKNLDFPDFPEFSAWHQHYRITQTWDQLMIWCTEFLAKSSCYAKECEAYGSTGQGSIHFAVLAKLLWQGVLHHFGTFGRSIDST